MKRRWRQSPPTRAGCSMEIQGPVPAPAQLPLPAVRVSVGTATSLVLRTIQLVAAAMSLAAMLSTDDYLTVPAFSFLAVAAGVQTLWSFGMLVTDLDVLVIKNKDAPQKWFVFALQVSDTIVGVVTFCAASAASGVLLFVKYDLRSCAEQHCHNFEDAITRAFIGFAAAIPSIFSNWITQSGPSDEAKLFWTEFIIFNLSMLGMAFACPSIGIGLMFSCKDAGNMMCNPNMALEFLIIGLFVLVSVSFLEVMCQFLAMCCGAATLTGPPLTCVFFVAGKWVMSLWSLGSACATLGLTQIFFANHLFSKSTYIYDAIFCWASLLAGFCYAMSSCLRAYLVLCRLRQPGAAQQ